MAPAIDVAFADVHLVVGGDVTAFALGESLDGDETRSDTAAAARLVDDAAHAVKALIDRRGGVEVKAGQVLSGVNFRKLMTALTAISDVLKSAGHNPEHATENPDDELEPMPPEAPIQPDSTAPSALPTGVKALPRDEETLTLEEFRQGMDLLADVYADLS
ncbi:hypothetical protein [Nonomuraea sp. NPDC046570]|uniref:hypothetical protein n=1 Tax=Nonomuraea sp. NPDC046570 TaxID=3155255 RepID=UPI00340DA16E